MTSSGVEFENCVAIGRNWTIFVHFAYWCSETDWNITILISAY